MHICWHKTKTKNSARTQWVNFNFAYRQVRIWVCASKCVSSNVQCSVYINMYVYVLKIYIYVHVCMYIYIFSIHIHIYPINGSTINSKWINLDYLKPIKLSTLIRFLIKQLLFYLFSFLFEIIKLNSLGNILRTYWWIFCFHSFV